MLKSSKSTSSQHLPAYTYNTPAALPSLKNALKSMGSSQISLISLHSNRSHNSFASSTTALSTNQRKKTPQINHVTHMTPETIEHGSTVKKSKTESIDTFLRKVTHVSLVGKNIGIMEGLDLCRNLNVLYLYENNIKRIEGLSACVSLTRLYLQNNLVEEISGLDVGLDKLTELHLAGNKIKFVTGLEALPALEILHLDGQHIDEPMMFDVGCMDAIGTTLKKLTASGNGMTEIHTLTGLAALEELEISKNNISEWEEVHYVLASCENLQSLNITGNPIANILKFRQKAILASPSLVTINEKDVSPVERDFLVNMETAKKQRSKTGRNRPQQSMAPVDPHAAHIFALTMLGNHDQKPIPHLPPYASQYRDLMLHQLAASQLHPQTRPGGPDPLMKKLPPPGPPQQRPAKLERSSETFESIPKFGFPTLPSHSMTQNDVPLDYDHHRHRLHDQYDAYLPQGDGEIDHNHFDNNNTDESTWIHGDSQQQNKIQDAHQQESLWNGNSSSAASVFGSTTIAGGRSDWD